MLTKNEITSLNLSPTKKDFVQIWTELLDVAGKLSERWDPTSTNESDPGIVILKALTGLADKLNYNIDKNTLEAFMPTAAQEDSMRKLCDMLGYNIKYYQSAQTTATIKYYNSDPSEEESAIMKTSNLLIPKFTVLTNGDNDISYFTINEEARYISAEEPTKQIPCMEGQIVKCESINDNGVISANQISEDNRFYLPEAQIAENGIFIYNVFQSDFDNGSLVDGEIWRKVDNLNTQTRGSRVFKFGFDSYEGRPYVEFPEDYSELFNEGLFIYYTRTSGISGNISAGTLTQIELPKTGDWSKVSADSFSVTNTFAATTGSNVETIKQAYNNFKKTIGTFETLVTCRDYMNKIYLLTDEQSNKPLVSNILVTDIRSDLNRALTICSCDESGIFYKETSDLVNRETIDTDITFESTQEESSSPVEEIIKTDAETRYRPSYLNKPKVSDTVYVTPDGKRATCWYIDFGNNKLYLYADELGSEWIPAEHLNPKSFTDKEQDNSAQYFKAAPAFLEIDPDTGEYRFEEVDFEALGGEASAYDSEGNRSDFWLITQNGKTFTTMLPIDWVITSHTIIEQKQTKTIKEQQTKTITQIVKDEPKIDHFDLILYPFKSYTQLKNNVKDIGKSYDASFAYDVSAFDQIKDILDFDSTKTIAHNIKKPEPGDIVSINNYLRLNATIATNSKITVEEGSLIIENIKIALANAFNMRELDFGEEIPFESIVEVMEKADSRIKVVALNEPSLYTTFTKLKNYDENNVPILVEYAVNSDHWLTPEAAYATGRLGTAKEGTFDINEAKDIYNYLAVRNVLAGRLPLFNYNNTFSSSFYESACQETSLILTDPSETLGLVLPQPTADTPYVVYVHTDGTIYTGIYEEVEDASAPNGVKSVITYYKTSTPSILENIIEDNLITDVQGEDIVEIQTDYNIKPDAVVEGSESGNVITDVTLAENEYVKFRAPNFTTVKTYPAYVNYHLALDTKLLSVAEPAKADTLFNLLDKDHTKWTLKNTDIGWQKVLDHFENNKPASIKKFTLSQKISPYQEKSESTYSLCDSEDSPDGKHAPVTKSGETRCKYCKKLVTSSELTKGPIIIKLDNNTYAIDEGPDSESISEIFAKSGCAKFTNTISANTKAQGDDPPYIIKAKLTWDTSNGGTGKGTGPDLSISLAVSSPFITDYNTFNNIQQTVNEKIEELRGQTSNGKPALPTDCAWTLSFSFECVPFEPSTLTEWERFVKTSAAKKLFGFTPVEDTGTVFWRGYGEGYQLGKYVLENTEKLLKFDTNYFGSLPETRLKGLYLIESSGKDSKAAIIKNNSEYSLKTNEYLYIEYTPSTVSEDGMAQASEAVTEIYGPGTIIRPTGFTTGLMDSTYYALQGNSPFKTVTFDNPTGSGSIELGMQRFSANEQVEIRDLSKVELTKDSFKSSSVIYVYKNFSNDVLEDATVNADGQRVYTLKDGEYIFYTDQNQTELAYFTNGTQVAVEGNLEIPSFDTIDIADILNSGLQEIPWKRLSFSNDDSLTFQEYQYVTLGPGDTITEIDLTDSTNALTKQWQYCDNITYCLAGTDQPVSLSPISIYNAQAETTKGNGWEASSVLELDVSSDKAQTLRNDGKVETSLTLVGTASAGGGVQYRETITPSTDSTLSIKTNLACYSSNSQLSIDDIYSNPGNAESFTLKVFTSDAPAIVKTAPGRVVPLHQEGVVDLINWQAEETLTSKDYTDLWTTVNLATITPDTADGIDYDKALRLPINVLPNTYGIFCLYLNYHGEQDSKTWIEILPGTRPEDVTILNAADLDYYVRAETGSNKPDKLYLQPGINCIRVAKSGKLFVKASEGAQGALSFDDLRLVNCQQLEYTLVNGENKNELVSSTTQGLNLQQLGYLLISDTDASTIDLTDENVFLSVKTAYFDQADAALEKEASKANKDFSLLYTGALSLKDKLQTLVNIEDSIVEDLDYICNTNNISTQDLTDLVNTHISINDMLSKEQDLLDALTANKNIEASEELLIQLLESLNIAEGVQEQLKQKLDLLIEQAQTKAESLSEDDILSDFTECLDVEEKSKAFETVKKTAKERLEEAFSSQLETLADNFEQLIGSDESNRLLTLLTDLHASKSADKRAQLTTLITQLRSAVELDDLDGWLRDLESTLNTNKDYTQIASTLLQIRNLLSTRDIKLIVTELEQAAVDSNDTHAKLLVEEIQSLVNSADSEGDSETETTLKSLVNTIDDIRNTIASKSTLTDDDKTGIKQAILGTNSETDPGLSADIRKFYEEQRDKLLEDILGILDELSDSLTSTGGANTLAEDLLIQNINALSASLDDNKTYQLESCIEQVSEIVDLYSDNLTAIEIARANETWDENIAEYIEAAIVSVWPTYMKAKINYFIERTNNIFNESFKFNLDTLDVTTDFNQLTDELTSTMQSIIDIDAFEALFNDVNSTLNTANQSKANISLIKDISSNISLSHDVSTAMQKLQSTADGARNTIIIQLINSILSTDSNDITKRRQLIASLKTELANATFLNEQIIKAIDSILYPTIFKFESTAEASDSFYETLLEATKKTKKAILNLELTDLRDTYVNITSDGTSKSYDSYYLDVLTSETADFRDALLELDVETTTHLPEDFAKNMKDLKEAAKVLSDVAFVQENKSTDMTSAEVSWLTLELTTSLVKNIIETLVDKLNQLERGRVQITDEFREAYRIICAENQLLEKIRTMDKNREFFYTVPVEAHLAIDFNESDSKLNTLMNPMAYYDINNVNNNFVISKIDINYLTNGLQIARSSRLN